MSILNKLVSTSPQSYHQCDCDMVIRHILTKIRDTRQMPRTMICAVWIDCLHKMERTIELFDVMTDSRERVFNSFVFLASMSSKYEHLRGYVTEAIFHLYRTGHLGDLLSIPGTSSVDEITTNCSSDSFLAYVDALVCLLESGCIGYSTIMLNVGISRLLFCTQVQTASLRYTAMRLLCDSLGMSTFLSNYFKHSRVLPTSTPSRLQNRIEHRFSNGESSGLGFETSLELDLKYLNDHEMVTESLWSGGAVCVCGYVLQRRRVNSSLGTQGSMQQFSLSDPSSFVDSKLVATKSGRRNLQRLAKAVVLQTPIIVQGEVGCGKSFYIRELARLLGQSESIVELNLDDQTDSKTLFGSYVCSDVPGEFVWQSGAVTQAALRGDWLVIEDIEHVPLDVIAAMSSLLEKRRVPAPNKGPGKDVPVHPSFRLFGTRTVSVPTSPQQQRQQQRVSKASSSSSTKGNDAELDNSLYMMDDASGGCVSVGQGNSNSALLDKLGDNEGVPTDPSLYVLQGLKHFSYLWQFVPIVNPSRSEISAILTSRYPSLLLVVVEKLLETYDIFGGGGHVGGHSSSTMEGDIVGATADTKNADSLRGSSSAGSMAAVAGKVALKLRMRTLTLRDLIKVAGRVERNIGPSFNHAAGRLTDAQRRGVLSEVADVFAAAIRDKEQYEHVLLLLAQCWEVPECDLQSFLINACPQIDIGRERSLGEVQGVASQLQHQSLGLAVGDLSVGRIVLARGRCSGSLCHAPDVASNPTASILSPSSTAAGGASTGSSHAHALQASSSHQSQQQQQQQQQQLPQSFAYTNYALRLLEKVSACVVMGEPVLLVGETGSGKTTSVQELANMTGRRLIVQNLSLSTDASDLLGGFRPVTMRQLLLPCYETFVGLFQATFSSTQNSEFLQVVAQSFRKEQWKKMIKAFQKAEAMATKKLAAAAPIEVVSASATAGGSVSQISSPGGNLGGDNIESLVHRWAQFKDQVERFEANLPRIEFGFAFAYVDGLLLEAMKSGHWLLLDEINLASAETLQSLAGILDGQSRLCLSERGDLAPVVRHPEFRIFAAMNPPTDVGKRELPMSLRCRFTEIYTEEMTDPQDLRSVVMRYLGDISDAPVDEIVQVYLTSRFTSEGSSDISLVDGAGQKPRYSLRSLTRSLRATKKFLALKIRPLRRALFEAFLLNFYTLLADKCRQHMWDFLKTSFGVADTKELVIPFERPAKKESTASEWVLVKPFWLRAGPLAADDWAEKNSAGITRFVITKSVQGNIRDLSAAIAADVAPVLLQGPTSVGKTTMVEYLAARTGHKCVRINNHEHTDVQEYIGGYVTNLQGHLEFRDGLLVEALRLGHWIILDELNLAPSDVLEALNRLLDDNKELLIPETGEIVRPAPGFALFATQNPPGAYGGRKMLSRAFRNRFLELNICDLPLDEIEEIVTASCGIAPKFSKMLVKTMEELRLRRQQSNLFQGKYGLITTRDLIKWGKRHPQRPIEVASEGYMLLAEKLREPMQQAAVLEIINSVCKTQLDPTSLYEFHVEESGASCAVAPSGRGSGAVVVAVVGGGLSSNFADGPHSTVQGGDLDDLVALQQLMRSESLQVEGVRGVAVTATLRRLWKLVGRCIHHSEPALLIGETGTGKTTVCQLFAAFSGQHIRILNCHQSTETADIIGGLRPVRGREHQLQIVKAELTDIIESIASCCAIESAAPPTPSEVAHRKGDDMETDEAAVAVPPEITSFDATPLLSVLDELEGDEVKLKQLIDELSKAVTQIFKIQTNYEDAKLALQSSSDGKRKRAKVGKKDLASSEHRATVRLELKARWESLLEAWHRCHALFEWQDGPLIGAMKQGDIFVLDEINLAEDAVIERLNSVLESGRGITLAEKGGLKSERLIAHPNFRFLATMNPGGDFGKRELSPALRSRFTEIYVPTSFCEDDIVLIVSEILNLEAAGIDVTSEQSGQAAAVGLSTELAVVMVRFMSWLNVTAQEMSIGAIQISVREVLAWARFIAQWISAAPGIGVGATSGGNAVPDSAAYCALLHGAHMVLLDGLGIGLSIAREKVRELKDLCVDELLRHCPPSAAADVLASITAPKILNIDHRSSDRDAVVDDVDVDGTDNDDADGARQASVGPTSVVDQQFQLGSFKIPIGSDAIKSSSYVVNAQSTVLNMWRVLRAMQISRPILLEGPPGVGKSSLIANLASLTGHRLLRINLSEHSEISDLLGTDLPSTAHSDPEDSAADSGAVGASVSSSSAPKFVWCDGVFLTAMKRGDWVLLDELNLAPQSVLEGLNACLDHRGEVFLPEIGQTVHCSPSFRVFCAQNPMVEGGGRKGLPQSFLSRFSRVFVEAMSEQDMMDIVSQAYGTRRPFQESPQDNMAVSSADFAVPSIGSRSNDEASTSDCVEDVKMSDDTQSESSPHRRGGLYVKNMVRFVRRLQEDIVESKQYGREGSPWEFNLRDVLRWCEYVEAMVVNLSPKELSTATEHSYFRRELRSGHAAIIKDVEQGEAHDLIALNMMELVVAEGAYLLFVSRLRSHGDRQKACNAYLAIFGTPLRVDYAPRTTVVATHSDNRDQSLWMSPVTRSHTELWIGLAHISVGARPCFAGDVGAAGNGGSGTAVNGALKKTSESVATCVSNRWPVLLVGPSGVGKRRCVRSLAKNTGNHLVEFSVTASTDSTELLGSFEQGNLYRQLYRGLQEIEAVVALLLTHVISNTTPISKIPDTDTDTDSASVATQIETAKAPFVALVGKSADLYARAQQSIESVNANNSLQLQEGQGMFAIVQELLQTIQAALAFLQRESQDREYIATVETALSAGTTDFDACYSNSVKLDKQRFEWVDGLVVDALEKGYWLLIDNINLCSASVLDRLNSLLEPDGVLLLTESGLGRVVSAHPSFRIFFCMNPAMGEISRAMRNRCVEIFVHESPDLDAILPTMLDRCSGSLSALDVIDLCEALGTATADRTAASSCDAIRTRHSASRQKHSSGLRHHLIPQFPKLKILQRAARLCEIEKSNAVGIPPELLTAKNMMNSIMQFVCPFAYSAHQDTIDDTRSSVAVALADSRHATGAGGNIELPSDELRGLLPTEECYSLICMLAVLNSSEQFGSATLKWFSECLKSVHARLSLTAGSLNDSLEQVEGPDAFAVAVVDAQGPSIAQLLPTFDECTKPSLTASAVNALVANLLLASEDSPSVVFSILDQIDAVVSATVRNRVALTLQTRTAETLVSAVRNLMQWSDNLAATTAMAGFTEESVFTMVRHQYRSPQLQCIFASVSSSLCTSREDMHAGKIRLHKACSLWQLTVACVCLRLELMEAEAGAKQLVASQVSMSSSEQLPSLFCVAVALQEERLSTNNKDLVMLSAVYAIISAVDTVLENIVSEYDSCYECAIAPDHWDSITGAIVGGLTALLRLRDMLSRILLSSRDPEQAKKFLPWDPLTITIKWMRKSLRQLTASTAAFASSRTTHSLFQSAFTPATDAFARFDRVVDSYFSRSSAVASAGSVSTRLWKEGGHAVVPALASDWSIMRQMQVMVERYRYVLPSFLDTTVPQLSSSSVTLRDAHTASLLREWVCLLCTFFWASTNEATSHRRPLQWANSASIITSALIQGSAGTRTLNRGSTVSPVPNSPIVDLPTLIGALSKRFELEAPADVVVDSSTVSAMMTSADYYDDGGLDEDAFAVINDDILKQVNTQLDRAAELSVCTILEPAIISAVSSISHWNSKLLLRGELRDSELRKFRRMLSVTVSMLLRHSVFDPSLVRELQSLLWCLEVTKSIRQSHPSPPAFVSAAAADVQTLGQQNQQTLSTLLSLSRTVLGALDRYLYHIQAANLVNTMAVDFNYKSQTLSAILASSKSSSAINVDVTTINCSWTATATSGSIRASQPCRLETAFRHLDACALSPQLLRQGTAKLRLLARDSATLTVSTSATASKRLLQLFRASVASFSLARADQESSSSSTFSRYHLAALYLLDVLVSCRDLFYRTSAVMPRVLECVTAFQASLAESEGEDRERLAKFMAGLQSICISEHCMDAAVAAVFRACAEPAIEIIRAAAAAMGTGGPSNDDDAAVVGRVWVLVGLLRIRFLCMSFPVDPATRPANKAALLEEVVDAQRDRFAVNHATSCILSGTAITGAMVVASKFINSTTARIRDYKSKAIQRPDSAARFDEVFFEIRSVCDEVCDQQRILTLMESCLGASAALKAQQSFTAKAESLIERIEHCAREEIVWQGSVSSFIDRCRRAFVEYDDVTSPIVSALQNISSGLRMVVGGSFSEALVIKATRSVAGGDGLRAWWANVMQYPQSVSIDLSSAAHMVRAARAGVSEIVSHSELAVMKAIAAMSDHSDASYSSSHTTATLPSAKIVDSLSPHLVLLLGLSKIDYLVGGGTLRCNDTLYLFKRIMMQFVSTHLRGEAEKAQRKAEKESLYRNKTSETVFESNEEKEEEAALRLHFPNHLKEFKDIIEAMGTQGGEGLLQNSMDDIDIGEELTEEDLELEAMSVDDHTTAALIGYHARMVFCHRQSELRCGRGLWLNCGPAPLPLPLSSRTNNPKSRTDSKALTSKPHTRSARPSLSVVVVAPSSDSLQWNRNFLSSQLYIQGMLTAKALDWSVRRLAMPTLDGQLSGGSLMLFATMADRSATVKLNSSSQSWVADNWRFCRKIDRDLLFLLDPTAEVNNHRTGREAVSMRQAADKNEQSSWKPADFHVDPNPAEVVQAAPALKAIFSRACELLVMFPANELLVQVCKVAARISDFHITTPLGKMLISLELLVRKAEEWEQFAAKHCSLQAQMATLSSLIARWRQLELQSWENLLRCKELTYAQAAMKYWFKLAQALQTPPERIVYDTELSDGTANHAGSQWLELGRRAPTWMWSSGSAVTTAAAAAAAAAAAITSGSEHALSDATCDGVGMSADVAGEGEGEGEGSTLGAADDISQVLDKKLTGKKVMTETEYLGSVFDIVDGFLRNSLVGQFPMRLHLIRLFTLQMQQDLHSKRVVSAGGAKSFDDAAYDADLASDVASVLGQSTVFTTGEGQSERLRERVANTVFGVWQYYDQFLPAIRKFQETLKSPIQQKLKDQIKIGKWDQMNTYALIEHSERVHRKLNKLIREYQGDVLEYPVAAILRKEILGDLVSDQGELNMSIAVPSMQSIFPILPSLGDAIIITETKVAITEDKDGKEVDEDFMVPVRDEEEVRGDAIVASLAQKMGVGKKGSDAPVAVKMDSIIEYSLVSNLVFTDVFGPVIVSLNSLGFTDADIPNFVAEIPSQGLQLAGPAVPKDAAVFGVQRAVATVLLDHPKLSKTKLLCNRMDKYLVQSLEIPLIEDPGSPIDDDGGKLAAELDDDSGPSEIALRYQGKARYGLRAAEIAEGLCDDIFSRITALRGDGVAKSMKHRSVGDLLRTLRDHGISHLRSSAPIEARQTIVLLSLPAPLPCEICGDFLWSVGAPRDMYEKAERYHIRNVAEMNQLRTQATSSMAKDVSMRDVALIMGLCENLFSSMIRMRAALGAALEDVKSTVQTLQLLRTVAEVPSTVLTAFGSQGRDDDSFKHTEALFYAAIKDKARHHQVQQLYGSFVRPASGVMLDNLMQLRSLVQVAAAANSPHNVEDDPVIPVVADRDIVRVQKALEGAIRKLEKVVERPDQAARQRAADLSNYRAGEDDTTASTVAAAADSAVSVLSPLGSYCIDVGNSTEETTSLESASASSLAELSKGVATSLVELETVADALRLLVTHEVTDSVLARFTQFVTTLQSQIAHLSASEEEQKGFVICDDGLDQATAAAAGLSITASAPSCSEESVPVLAACIDDCLIAIQKIRSAAALSDAPAQAGARGNTIAGAIRSCFGESIGVLLKDSLQTGWHHQRTAVEAAEKEMCLHDCMSLGVASVASVAVQLQKVERALDHVGQLIRESSVVTRYDPHALADSLLPSCLLSHSVVPLVRRVLGVSAVLVNDLCMSYKSCGKLLYVCLRVFRTLLAKGLCSDQTKEAEGEGDGAGGEMNFEDDVEGTGMGEGEGKKDVSDQIQNEDQLMGLKDDEQKDRDSSQKQQEKKTLKEEEKDKGVEMSQDFDGEMFDLPPEDAPDDQDEDEDEKDEKEELEREMGDADQEDIVDEKQWDDEEDDKPQEDGDEKFEKDSKMQGEALEDEMRTREDDDKDSAEKDDKEESKEGDKGEAPKEKNQREDDGGGGEDDDEEEEKINEDAEENYQEKPQGIDVRKDEQPEEQKQEDEAKGEEEEGGPPTEGEQGGDERPEDEGGNDDLPEDMQFDGDEGGDDEDGDKDAMEEEEQQDEDNKEDGKEAEEDTMDAADSNDEAEEEDAHDEQLAHMAGRGNVADEQDQQQEEEEDKSPDEEGEKDAEKDEVPPQPKEAQTHKPTFGVTSATGEDAVTATEEQMKLDETSPREDDAAAPQDLSGPKGAGGHSQGYGDDGQKQEVGETPRDEMEQQRQKQRRQQRPPNPFQQKGDLNEKWHRRLNIIEDDDQASEEEEGGADEDGGGGNDEQDKPERDSRGLFERLQQDDDPTGAEQVLDNVTEEETVSLRAEEQKEHADERPNNDPTAMEEDQQKAPEPDSRKDEKRKRANDRGKAEQDKKRMRDDVEEAGDAMEASDDDRDDEFDEDDSGADDDDDYGDDELATVEPVPEESTQRELDGKVFSDPTFRFRDSSTISKAQQKSVADVDDSEGNDVAVGGLELAVRDGGWSDLDALAAARELWAKNRFATEGQAVRLCEQLRLILEPTLATRLQGDYRTGKRINMRRVISYVASGFRKDKIWLRRTKPAKREYQVMLMIDNSSSMGAAGPIALAALATMSTALTRLEVGELAVVSFSDRVELVHPFGQPFSDETGAKIFAEFDFSAGRTRLGDSLAAVTPIFAEARSRASTSAGTGSVLQLCFVISDARIDSDNRQRLDGIVRSLAEANVLVVLVVIDCNERAENSIFKTRTVEFKGDKVVTSSYLDNFPFPYYVTIQRSDGLADALSDALKQWFELIGTQLS